MTTLLKAILYAKEMAKEIQKKYNSNKIAVDVKKIAKKLGIDVVYKDFPKNDEISGLVKRAGKNNRPVIAINKTHTSGRKNFTLAHEIGHFVLHSTRPLHIDSNANFIFFRNYNSSDATHLKEIQANQFAAELLMPEEKILEETKNNKNLRNLEKISKEIEKLAKKYEVSKEAMTIRINKFIY